MRIAIQQIPVDHHASPLGRDGELHEQPRVAVRVKAHHNASPTDCRVLRNATLCEQRLDGLLRVVGFDGRKLGGWRDGVVGIGGEVDVEAGYEAILVGGGPRPLGHAA